MMFWIESILEAVISVFCVLEMFHIFDLSKKRIIMPGNIVMAIILGLGLFLSVLCPIRFFYLRWIIALLFIIFTMYKHKGYPMKQTLYIAVLILTLTEFMKVSECLMESILCGNFPEVHIWSLISLLVTKGILIGIIFAIKAVWGRKLSVLPLNKQWPAFLLVQAGSLLLTVIFWVDYIDNHVYPVQTIFMVAVLLFISLVSLHLLSVMIQEHKNLLDEKKAKEKHEKHLKSYETIGECLEEQRRRTHEYKNYIHCIYYLIELDKQEELHKYVNDLRYGMHLKNVVVCDTEHILIDAIVNAKHKEATARGIEFTVQADKLHDFTMQDEDVIVLISNLMNNAVEAAQNGPKPGYISVDIKEKEQKFCIKVTNSHANLIKTEEGEISTGKTEDSANHGFGLKNIKTTIEKYDGQCNISYTDSEFTVDIEVVL